mmetsp:Transcript_15373/g.28722  ORF Transcript_15373/g.28722 Transcript_15373/m.28722 type:complete len:248 (-) Transcript_15373:123-866(-)
MSPNPSENISSTLLLVDSSAGVSSTPKDVTSGGDNALLFPSLCGGLLSPAPPLFPFPFPLPFSRVVLSREAFTARSNSSVHSSSDKRSMCLSTSTPIFPPASSTILFHRSTRTLHSSAFSSFPSSFSFSCPSPFTPSPSPSPSRTLSLYSSSSTTLSPSKMSPSSSSSTERAVVIFPRIRLTSSSSPAEDRRGVKVETKGFLTLITLLSRGTKWVRGTSSVERSLAPSSHWELRFRFPASSSSSSDE